MSRRATTGKTYDLFFTHAWRFHDDWTRMGDLLDGVDGLRWRNFSVPWHDPALTPNSEVGREAIYAWLENQIIPVHAVIFLSGVYGVPSTRKWLDLEVELARKHGKPVFAVPALDGDVEGVPAEIRELCDGVLPWDGAQLIAAIDRQG